MVRTGVVRKWLDDKGFGFITPDDGGEDIFVHQTEVKSEGFRSLQEGEAVEFDTTTDRGREKAVSVTGPHGVPVKGSSRPAGGGGGRPDRSGDRYGGGGGGYGGG
eukprot:RCo015044